MNTMKRIFLCTPLLLLAGLCGQPVSAQIQYNSSVNLIAPTNGSSYEVTVHSGFYYAEIPISITNQYVEIAKGTPSTYYSVGWSMTDGASAGNSGTGLAYDYSGAVFAEDGLNRQLAALPQQRLGQLLGNLPCHK